MYDWFGNILFFGCGLLIGYGYGDAAVSFLKGIIVYYFEKDDDDDDDDEKI